VRLLGVEPLSVVPWTDHQRVRNFGWYDLPGGGGGGAQQYHALGRAIVRLLELVDSVWGGRGGKLKEVEQSLITGFSYPTFSKIQRNLKAKIKALCRKYECQDVTPLGWPL
jgi:hypothetical protein